MNKPTVQKDVILSIKSSQQNESDSDSVELVTEGRFYKLDDSYYISYKESELTGLEGRTTLKVDKEAGIVTMSRSGVNRAHMVFQHRQKHFTHYDTGYGTMDMSITTRKLQVDIDEEQARAELLLKYTLDINNRYVSTNTIQLQVKEATPFHEQSHPVC
ncbi:MAG: DUF1934 domain-containing protein [Eubacteriales bacterium]|jgi:uncharacterized beta-barrel protein YwiB (DUF1934 family)